MKLYAYPVPGKEKSRALCLAFAKGCDGLVVDDATLRDGPAFFAGVMPGNEFLWRRVLHDTSRDFYFEDNSYFDGSREKYFRVAKNRLQHSGLGQSDGKRLQALGVHMEPWRRGGSHIVVCPQSEHFMRVCAEYRGDWTADVLRALGTLTDRRIKVRPWIRNKGEQARSLAADLKGAHALVTWSSAAAVTAVLAGVPVVCAEQSAAWPMAGAIEQIENLPMREREPWAAALADAQWTISEFMDGTAWRALNA